MRMGRTTDPVEKSSSSAQLNWSRPSEASGRSEEGSSASGLTLDVTLRAARFASRDWQLEQTATRMCGCEEHVTSAVNCRVSWGAASILPSFLVRRLVEVFGGNLRHFQLPTRSYLRKGPCDELAWARSAVIRTWVSTRDLVPVSGILGKTIGRSEQLSCGGQTTLWTTLATCWTGWGGGAGLVGRTLMVSGVIILASCVICSGECFWNAWSATA